MLLPVSYVLKLCERDRVGIRHPASEQGKYLPEGLRRLQEVNLRPREYVCGLGYSSFWSVNSHSPLLTSNASRDRLAIVSV